MSRKSFVKKQAVFTGTAAAAAANAHVFIYVSGAPSATLKKRKITGATKVWTEEGLDVQYDPVHRISGHPEDVRAALVNAGYDLEAVRTARIKAGLPDGEPIDGNNINDTSRPQFRAAYNKEKAIVDAQPKKGKTTRGDSSKKLSGGTALNYLIGFFARIKYGGKIGYTTSSDPPIKRKGVTRTLKEKYDAVLREQEVKWLNVTKWTGGPAATGSRSEGPPSEKSTQTFYDPEGVIRLKSTSLRKYADAMKVLGLEWSTELLALYKQAQSNASTSTGVKGGKGVVHNPPPAAELIRDKEKARSPSGARSGGARRVTSPATPSSLLRGTSPSQGAPVIGRQGASFTGSVPLVQSPGSRSGSVRMQ